MHITSLLTLALAATASAGVIRTGNDMSANDITGMLQVLDRINTGMNKIGTDVKLWEGDRQMAEQIMEDGRQIISDLGVGARFIEHSPIVGTMESFQLLSPMNTLNGLTDTFASSLISKKPFVERLQLMPQSLTLLEHARHGALDLSREVALKMPPLTSWGAQPATNLVVDKLDKAIKAFGGGQNVQNPAQSNSPSPPNSWGQPANPAPYTSQPQQPRPPSGNPATNPYASSPYASTQPYQNQGQWNHNSQPNQNQGQWNSNSRPQYQDSSPVSFSAPPA